VRAIFLTRFTNQLPKMPETVWHETYTSLRLLLPRTSIFVHHGGIGTIALALRAGVPQLVLPGAHDNLDNGKHLEKLGCGLMQRNLLDSDAMIEKLKYLLTSRQVKNACQLIQAQVEPGTTTCARAVDAIEETFHNPGRTGDGRRGSSGKSCL
jgi:rhamnosyltransferase subunit B